MADLLPSTPDTSAADDAEPRVIGLDSDDADDLIGALSSSTARKLLTALHDEPATPSQLADTVDTSLQNTQYHLEKLEDADIIEVVDTAYSAKGREMKVYAPSNQPLVVFAGSEENSTGLKAALSRLLGAFGLLAIGAAAVQEFLGDGLAAFFGGGRGPTGSPAPGPSTQPVAGNANNTTNATTTAVETTTQAASTAADTAAAAVSPGLAFFLGGAIVLVAGFAYWYTENQ
ncbi:ArsR/SmtB family transcription factor [Haloarchaeobius amylolyticus]|uniref:ArsR/SmtB family transcription factor n=1 Tax=Haloarchaeobius amylolyticus TaxID=1198296 RepID=UPI00226FA3EE|nr:helix-turn-helix domain-containing protein [Haloarchaeobius amylolyticus]